MKGKTNPNVAGNPFDMDSAQLVRTIRLSNEVITRDRVANLRTYRSCFCGNELVDYLVRRFGIGREQATRLGQQLMAKDLIRHVAAEHDFRDSPLFYSFNETKKTEKPSPISAAAASDIAQEMRFSDGVRAGVRRRWLVNYPQCFCGREVVDWVCETTGLSRDMAFQVGQAMLAANRIRHVLDEQPFRDDGHLYRFV